VVHGALYGFTSTDHDFGREAHGVKLVDDGPVRAILPLGTTLVDMHVDHCYELWST